MQNVDIGPLLLMLISASAYVAATYFMKLWVNHHTFWLAGLIALTLLVGVVSELIVLKDEKMGEVYFVIIGFECLLVAAFAKMALNESYSLTEVAGLLLIVAGVAVFQLPEILGHTQESPAHAATAADFKTQPVSARQVPQREGKSNRLSAAL